MAKKYCIRFKKTSAGKRCAKFASKRKKARKSKR